MALCLQMQVSITYHYLSQNTHEKNVVSSCPILLYLYLFLLDRRTDDEQHLMIEQPSNE